MYGIVAHRLMYVDRRRQPDRPGRHLDSFGSTTQKDVYGRIDYKIGGMALDGTTAGVTLPPENWGETSFRLGAAAFDTSSHAGTCLRSPPESGASCATIGGVIVGRESLVHSTRRLRAECAEDLDSAAGT